MARLTPDLLLSAYADGLFPMSDDRNSTELFWLSPKERGIFPIGGFHISRSLARRLASGRFTASFDTAFRAVMLGCADRPETWINDEILDLYCAVHALGAAHSVEIWEDDRLVGGVYGIALGGAFFGESMFSRVTDASKAALAVLHHQLATQGFTLFDTQFLTPHLASLGAIEIPQRDYLRQLRQALKVETSFYSAGAGSGAGCRFSTGSALDGTSQRKAQTS